MRRELVAVSLLSIVCLAACAPPGPSAFVTFNLVPNESCEWIPQTTGNKFYPYGLYDIAPGGKQMGLTVSDNCAHPYVVNLLVNSFLRPNADPMTIGRAEPDVLQLHHAEVRLSDINDSTIVFKQTKDALPNPFLVNTNNSLFPATGNTPSVGVAAVQVIPRAYAEQLNNFVGKQILSHIQIYATTTGNIDVDFKPFVYPIEICDGCRTYCQGVLSTSMMTRMDLANGKCDDNESSDDRFCIDPDC